MPAIPADVHTTELGQPGGPLGAGRGLYGSMLAQQWEETAELAWPLDVAVYDRMRRSDAQVAAVLRSIFLPILGARWHVPDDGADPAVVQFVRTELGLTGDRQATARRRRRGIVWRDYLRHALLALVFGHMPFEQVYEVGPPGPELDGVTLPRRELAHLRKLAPRMPRSLTAIDVEDDGGLAGVRQLVYRRPGGRTAAPVDLLLHGTSALGLVEEVAIPARDLVFHANDREGGDWRGSSILRPAYKHWLILDRLLRLGPMTVERNGMGLPVVTFDDAAGASQSGALDLARKARAGEDAGVALPAGYTLALVGVTGSTKDELPLVNWHAQQIGKNMLAMFLDLGHDAGARSLGDTFVDLFAVAMNGVAGEAAEVATEHVVRDLVALNFGEDEPYPPVTLDQVEADQVLQPADLAALVTAGVILPDDDLDAEVRRRYRLPAPPPAEGPDDEDDPLELDPTAGPLPLPPGPPGMPPASPPQLLPGPQGVAEVPIPLPPAPSGRNRPARRTNAAQLAERARTVAGMADAQARAAQAAEAALDALRS